MTFSATLEQMFITKEEAVMTKEELIELINGAAKARNELPVPKQYIEEALRRIDAGQEEVIRYPNGNPSLKDAYDVAARLFDEAVVKN